MGTKRKSENGLSQSQIGNRYRNFFEEVGAMCETAKTTHKQRSWTPNDKFELFKKLVEMFEEKTRALKAELAQTKKAEA
ncbi:MAG: hypothetical protein J6W10_02200 [Kiritimatiellae bacterium]|nr:hypothetical protein [Kiritimatiellia bacterium]